MTFDVPSSKKLKIQLFVFVLLALIPRAAVWANQSTIGQSQNDSATERNNARLIVKDASGILHAVYYDNGIVHSWSDDNARTWSIPPVRITDIGRNPSLAVDNNGLVHLVYKRGGIVAYDIVHRSFDGTWSNEATVFSSPQVAVSRPSLVVDSSGDLHCVWQRSGYGSTPNSEIWYCKRTTGTWAGAMNVSNTYGSSEYPSLAMGDDNNVHVFWKDSGEVISNPKMVLYRKYTQGSGWDTGYTNVSNTINNGSYSTMDPCAIVDSQNNVHLVWKDYQPGNKEIFYKKCIDGIWDETPLNLSNTDEASDKPIISVDVDDNLTVAWAEKTDGIRYEVVICKFTLSNNHWSDATNISNSPGNESLYPNMPAFTEPGIVCIWTEEINSSYNVTCVYNDLMSSVEEGMVPESEARLISNHPNPFNPATTISFELSTNSMVSLAIHDAGGKLVKTLLTGQRASGSHHAQWDGRDTQNKNVSSGIYFSILEVDGKRHTRKMVLLR